MKIKQFLGPLFPGCADCRRKQQTINRQQVRIGELESLVTELKSASVQGLQLPAAVIAEQQEVFPIATMAPEEGWAHLKASVTGFRKPFLQDAHEVVIDEENVVLLVCDGAGSLKNSKAGADFVVKQMGDKFRELLKSGAALSMERWSEWARSSFLATSQALKAKAMAERADPDSFGCTCIAVLAGKDFVACAHVGDGRAGYLDSSGYWLALMKPHKGVLANSTVFMTMLDASSVDGLVRVSFHGVRTRAVVALTDGPEDVCWQVSVFNPSGQIVVDPNQPSNEFLGKIANQLAGATVKKVPQPDLDRLWHKFLTDGSPKLAAQVDDKTMLMALRG